MINNPLFSAMSLYAHKQPKVEFYQDKTLPPNKGWRWRLSFSSDIVAASSEGYASKAEAKENFLKIEHHIRYLREHNKVD
jgi:uncharacterized protein YegP (UPF0339 family)